MLPLDYDTLAVADKFGNLSVLRLPAEVSAQVSRLLGGCCRWIVTHWQSLTRLETVCAGAACRVGS